MDEDNIEMTQEEQHALFEEAAMTVEGSNPELAVAMFETLLVQQARVADVDDLRMIEIRMYLGRAHMRAGDAELAVAVLRPALADAVRVTGEASRLTFSCMGNLCRALGALGEFTEAISMAWDLYKGRLDEYGETDNGTLNALGHVSQLMYEAGDIRKACELMEEQLEMRTQEFGPQDHRTETSRFNLTVMTARLEDDPRPVERLIRRYERDFGAVSPQVIALRTSLAAIYERLGRKANARAERAKAQHARAVLRGECD